MKFSAVLGAFAVASFATLANAAVVYTDATINNTTLADGSALTFSPGTEGDGLWNSRAFGNGGTVITSNENAENAPRLRVTVGGLTIGQDYDVFAYFWGASGGNTQLWRGRAGLEDVSGDLQGYNTVHFDGSSFLPMTAVTSQVDGRGINTDTLSTADASGFENGGYFSGSVLTEEADRRLFQVDLGTVTATSDEINIFIDDLANTSAANRTWFDGVGTQITAVPEPSGMLVLGLSALGVMQIRRRKRSN